jgi:hypothetical protein
MNLPYRIAVGLLLSLVWVWGGARAHAQQPTTVVLGLRLPSGAPVPGVTAHIRTLLGEPGVELSAGQQSCVTDTAGLCAVQLVPGEYVVRWEGSYQDQPLQPMDEQGSPLGHTGAAYGLGMALTESSSQVWWLFVLVPRTDGHWYPTYDLSMSQAEPLRVQPSPFVPAEAGFAPDPHQAGAESSPTPLPPVATVTLPAAPQEDPVLPTPVAPPPVAPPPDTAAAAPLVPTAIATAPGFVSPARQSVLPGPVWAFLLFAGGGGGAWYLLKVRKQTL